MPSIINSDDGVVSGTSGLKSTGGNDGITAFQQNGTERMRIDSSGNVGIGTSSPATPLHVRGANNEILRLQSSDATTGSLYLSYVDSAGTEKGYVGYGSSVSNDFIISNALSGDTRFNTNGSERMRIDSSGNVGIGTSSPLEKLQVAGPVVSTANLAALRASTMTMDYISGGRLIATGADSSTYSPIIFGTATTTTFAERGRFEANGNLKLALNLSVGSATPTTSGTGITFPATQSASTDANTLDDYEEGTFTPSVTYAGTGTPSYIYRLGRYVKIGKVVTCWVFLNWNENGSTGNITFTGFPFTSVNSGAQGIPSITSFGLTGLTTPVSLVGILTQNSTSMDLRLNDNAATVFSSTYTDNDQDVYLTVTYEVA